MKKRFFPMSVVAIFLAVYLSCYFCLSRRGYAEADRYGTEAFYYCLPAGGVEAYYSSSSASSRISLYQHYTCVVLFWPVNILDRFYGYGRIPDSGVVCEIE